MESSWYESSRIEILTFLPQVTPEQLGGCDLDELCALLARARATASHWERVVINGVARAFREKK